MAYVQKMPYTKGFGIVTFGACALCFVEDFGGPKLLSSNGWLDLDGVIRLPYKGRCGALIEWCILPGR